MHSHHGQSELAQAVDQILGYLNFSSGAEETNFLKNLNTVFRLLDSDCGEIGETEQGEGQTGTEQDLECAAAQTSSSGRADRSPPEPPEPPEPPALYERVLAHLRRRLETIHGENEAFHDAQQATRLLHLLEHHFFPDYLEWHRQVLFHRRPQDTFNSFFTGRACEVLLRAYSPDAADSEIVEEARQKLDDFLGHRPSPTLETRRVEPYAKEWIRPLPIYIREVGAAWGPYRHLVERTLSLLQQTPEYLLQLAQFDLDNMDELAIDPRPYDFDHPINRRPNYHFGSWDENAIGEDGFYHRFVVHEVTLGVILARLRTVAGDPEELLDEAAAVLAGTILMASGVSGSGPAAYDSTVTLSQLLPRIAGYRDEFYEQLLGLMSPPHRDRLIEEARVRHQAFGAARQDLNLRLANYRYEQSVRGQLSLIFARMGYPEAAMRQASIVPTAPIRTKCLLECELTRGRIALREGQVLQAAQQIEGTFRLIREGVHNGTLIDPWNLLGFDGNYSLFPASEDSVHDHRADELVELMERFLDYCSRLLIAAALNGESQTVESVQQQFNTIALWWHQFAAHELSEFDTSDPWEVYEAASNVARALAESMGAAEGRAAGRAAASSGSEGAAESAREGNVPGSMDFWARHARLFDAPRAFALAAEALIDRGDFGVSMGLLMYWLSQSEQYDLDAGELSFYGLANRWIRRIEEAVTHHRTAGRTAHAPAPATDNPVFNAWQQLVKFYDYLEANAEAYWRVPEFQLGRENGDADWEDELPDDAEGDGLYEAAYEGFVYRDSTDDGVEGSIDDGLGADDLGEELRREVERIVDRLNFLGLIADIFKTAGLVLRQPTATWAHCHPDKPDLSAAEFDEREVKSRLESWSARADRIDENLKRLLTQIEQIRLPNLGNNRDTVMEFNRQRQYRDSLLEQALSVQVDICNARSILNALQLAMSDCDLKSQIDQDPSQAIEFLFACLMRGDTATIRDSLDGLTDYLVSLPILYVPVHKGGKARDISQVRARQCAIGELLDALPRMGLFRETFELTRVVLLMERHQTTRHGAVTEFDALFRTAYASMVQTIIRSADHLRESLAETQTIEARAAKEQAHAALFDCLEMLTESMLMIWLSHSQTLRLSVLERINAESWKSLRQFIEAYGESLLTQTFLNYANIRAILYQGVEQWLDQMAREPESDRLKLFRDLDSVITRKQAARELELVLEAVAEHILIYREYNSTTTQSDRGEQLYIFIDFLRLLTRYERVSWHLLPVVWGHETLVRHHQTRVARTWRRSLKERIGDEAEKFRQHYEELKQKYSVHMATICDRLNERFLQPLQVDRLCSLVDQAMRQPGMPHSQRIFDLIEHQSNSLASRPSGSGGELPRWLEALQDEVEHVIEQQSDLRRPDRTDPQRGKPDSEESWSLQHRSPLCGEGIAIPMDQLRELIEELPRRTPE